MAGIEINAGVINYGGVPLAGAGLLASRPAFGVTGRLYIGTDTNLIYRDTGTAWVSISGSGTITGSGTAGQATFWSGASAISGDNAFFWDNTNKRLGLGTTTPGVRLDVHGTGVIQQLNGTGTNSSSFIDIQLAGSTQWRLGNFYNAALNQFVILNAAATNILFTIFQNGNTCIGPTTDAGYKLDVLGTTRLQQTVSIGGAASGLVQASITGTGYDLVLGTSGGAIFGFASQAISTVFNTGSIPLGVGTNAAQPLILGTQATERMRIDSTGRIGMGYTAPAITGLAVSGSIYQGSNTANSNFQLLCSANFYTGGFSPNFFTYTAGTVSIPLTNTGLVFKTAATITATLPLASGINNQYYIVVLTGTTVTLNRSGSDNIINTAGITVTSLTLTGYTKTLLYSDGGTTWYQLF